MRRPIEPHYPWQDAYFAVVFELDRARQQLLITITEDAMLKRARELTGGTEQDAERATLAAFSAKLANFKKRIA